MSPRRAEWKPYRDKIAGIEPGAYHVFAWPEGVATVPTERRRFQTGLNFLAANVIGKGKYRMKTTPDGILIEARP